MKTDMKNHLFSEIEYLNASKKDKLAFKCSYCTKTFYLPKFRIRRNIANKHKFCSNKCRSESINKKIKVVCLNCSKEFNKYLNQVKKFPNHFCSNSCSCTYQNTHKTTGTRISKLEKWLQIKLIELYPNLEIQFNTKDTINSELDIYIPSLNLAFELNGIFHYEPIYGQDKLIQIQNNDDRKFQACLEHNIELCIIDTSKQKYFKEKTSEKYLNIITNIINNKK